MHIFWKVLLKKLLVLQKMGFLRFNHSLKLQYHKGPGTWFLVHITKVWVAKVRARTHTCDVRLHVCVCVRNPFSKVCEMCVRAARFQACDVRLHFAHFLEQNGKKMAFFCLKNYSWTALEHLFSALELSFLLWNLLSYFETFFPALEHSFLL